MAQRDWPGAVATCDFRGATVIHLAARVHDPRAEAAAFEVDNVEKTRALVERAASGGAARFVFASTVKVFGEESAGRPFGEHDAAKPADSYAVSKWHAERAVWNVAASAGLPAVVVRIPLTYGPGAGGNFRALVRLADTPWWLPFGAIANRRSLVHVEDLVDALILAASHPGAPGRTLLAAHPQTVSTSRLIESMRVVLGRPRRLFPLPAKMLEGGATLIGQRGRMYRLTRSLEVDPSPFMRDLDWRPRIGLEAGLAALLEGSHT